MNTPSAPRFLERAFLFTIVCHAFAMLSMAVLLLPGMPGGNSLEARAAYLAANSWLWRLGWLPWQLTALSDLLLAIALIRTKWIPRFPTYFVLLLTVAAILVEQPNEFIWSVQAPDFAKTALENGTLSDYLAYETQLFTLVGGLAAFLYTIAALGWTWAFSKTSVWLRALSWLSLMTWGILLVVSISPLLPAKVRLDSGIVAAGNAIGFIFMMLWFFTLTENVLRKTRPESSHGRMAVWRYPHRNYFGVLVDLLANSRLARAFGELVLTLAFVSDISNVIYVNYLVEAEKLLPFVPQGLELQRLGKNGDYALFSHLTYQHGHFRPRMLNAFRRFMPSPIQSNWRIYVYDPETKHQGIYFVTTAMSQLLPALLARILAEALPMHLFKKAELTAKPDGSFYVCLDAGLGSAPDLKMNLHASEKPVFSPLWASCFESYEEFLAYCVPQDRGMSSQPWYSWVTRQEIELGIPLEACKPLAGEIDLQMATSYVGDAEAVCFRVPQVSFHFHKEEHDFRDSHLKSQS